MLAETQIKNAGIRKNNLILQNVVQYIDNNIL